jgi:hypothetical protein
LTPLTGGLISSRILQKLFWTKAGTYIVTYTVNYKNAAGQAQSESTTTTFDVVAPPITFSAKTTPLNPPIVVAGGKLQFGEEKPGLDGMTWTMTGLKVTPNFQGIAKLVQLVAPYSLTGSPLMVTSTYGNFILDNPANNPKLPFLDPVSVQATNAQVNSARPNISGKGFTDSPFESLPFIGGSDVFARDTFQTYLMYIPKGPNGNWTQSIYVSLGEMNWYWKGAASRALGGVGPWQLVPDTGQFTQNPTAQPSWTLPVWNNYAAKFVTASAALPATIIRGTVSDANGHPIKGATVTFTWTDTKVLNQQDKVTINTNASGQYSYAAAFGNANVTVTMQNGNYSISTPDDRSQNTLLNFP